MCSSVHDCVNIFKHGLTHFSRLLKLPVYFWLIHAAVSKVIQSRPLCRIYCNSVLRYELVLTMRTGHKKVQVGKDQEKAQSERDSHSKNRGGKKPN